MLTEPPTPTSTTPGTTLHDEEPAKQAGTRQTLICASDLRLRDLAVQRPDDSHQVKHFQRMRNSRQTAVRLTDDGSPDYSAPPPLVLPRCTESRPNAPSNVSPYTGWQPPRRPTLHPKSFRGKQCLTSGHDQER